MMNKRSIAQYASMPGLYTGPHSGHRYPTQHLNSLPSGLQGAVSLRSIFMLMLTFFSLIWITIYVYAGQNIVYRVGFYDISNNVSLVSLISVGNKVKFLERYLEDNLDDGSQHSSSPRTILYSAPKPSTQSPQTKRNCVDTLKGFYNYTCPTKLKSTDISNIYICGNQDRMFHYKLIFFTTMYNSASNIHIFNNTLHVMASMRTDFNLLPVLFIENPRSFIDANATKFVQTACDLGWVVLLAPHCNRHRFPVFRAMFNISMTNWDADWYGYSNGDMLFDETLFGSIDFIQSRTDILRVPLVIGRRYNSEITNTTQVGHYSEVKRLFRSSYIDRATAVDYFIARKNLFPWERVGDFVVGRPVYDTWLVWFATRFHLPIVDTTATVRAVHQIHQGRTLLQNTHKTRRVNDGMDYNKNLADSIGEQDTNMTLDRIKGYISCVPLKLLQMRRADLNHMIAEGETEIFGRGRRHFPVPRDDEEIRKTIDRERLEEEQQEQSYEGMDMGESRKAVTGAYEAESYAESEVENQRPAHKSSNVIDLSNAQVQSATRRKLLAAKGISQQQIKTNQQSKKKQQPKKNPQAAQSVAKPSQPEKPIKNSNALAQVNLKANPLNGTGDNVKTEKPSNKTIHVTQTTMKTIAINVTTPKPVIYASFNQSTPISTILHMNKTSIKPTILYRNTLFVNSSSNTRAIVTVTTLPSTASTKRATASQVKLPSTASTKRATASQVKLPSMIPYVHEAEDYVYVLVRRTRYLRRNKYGTKYRKVNYKSFCQDYDNIDLEIAELVTF